MRKLRIAQTKVKKVYKKKKGEGYWIFVLNKVKIADLELDSVGVTDGGKIIVRDVSYYRLEFDKAGLEKATGERYSGSDIKDMNQKHAVEVVRAFDVMLKIYPKELAGYIEMRDAEKDGLIEK